MKPTEDYGYSVRTFIALLLTAVPGAWGWFGADTIDLSPRYTCLGVGAAVALTIFIAQSYDRRKKRAADRQQRLAQAPGRLEKGRKKRRRNVGTAAPPMPEVPSLIDELGNHPKAPLPAVLTYFGPPCWALAFGMLGNRFLDTAPPVEYPARFVAYRNPPKSHPSITVTSWRPNRYVESFRYDPLKFSGISYDTPRDTPILIAVKPGFFGWPWVAGARRDKSL